MLLPGSFSLLGAAEETGMKKTNAGLACAVAGALLLPPVSNLAFAQAPTPPSVIAMRQQPKDYAMVTITYAYVPKQGYIAIHPSNRHGKMMTKVLGAKELAPGPHRNFTVKLNNAVRPGEKLWATLDQGTFTPGQKTAKAFVSASGRKVWQSFRIG